MTFNITPFRVKEGIWGPLPCIQYLSGYLNLGPWEKGRLKFIFINDRYMEL